MRKDINGRHYCTASDINPTLEHRALHSHAKLTPGTCWIITGFIVIALIDLLFL